MSIFVKKICSLIMRKDVFGIIYAGEENLNLRELVNLRSVGALPVGGRYRVVDFMLSNLVNSGIRNVGVIPRKNYHSLMDHLGSGKEWDLNRKNDGLMIIPPYDTIENVGSYHGITDTLKGASWFIRHATQPYCLLSGSSNIHNKTYNKMFDFHLETDADITMLYSRVDSKTKSCNADDVRLELDVTGRIVDMSMQNKKYDKMGMGVYLLRKDLLQYLVDDAALRGKYNLTTDVFLHKLKSLKIFGFEHEGYVGRINSTASYYKINMDFLTIEAQKDLFYTGNNVYTKIKDEVPTRYGDAAIAKNCLLGSGCVINGTVENSVLFRGVHIAKGVNIKNCIIMQGSEIYENSRLTNVILDKKVSVRPNSILTGSSEYPVIIPKGANV
ncbi:MAG: glucose-1-phosphate adenylyltransferase subunit GlgD [Oscillospiraceae bacterium]